MSLRAPLARALNHGAAHEGVGHWWVQRVTAIAIGPLALWLVWQLLALPDISYAAVSAWVAHSWNPVLLCLTIVLASWHGWLGVQIVVEDYIHGFLAKTAVLLLSTFLHALLAASGVYAVLQIALRGAR
jgi:succinate dehydrogenase / fumarate reductase membrane anchor subunit